MAAVGLEASLQRCDRTNERSDGEMSLLFHLRRKGKGGEDYYVCMYGEAHSPITLFACICSG